MKKLLGSCLLILLGVVACSQATPPAVQTSSTPAPAESAIAVVATTGSIEAEPTMPVPTGPAASPTTESLPHVELLNRLLFTVASWEEGQAILNRISASGDIRFVAGLIDTMRFQEVLRAEIGQTLNTLTGQELPPVWADWVEWAGQHPEIDSFEGFAAWKGNLFAQLDPAFGRFLYDGMKVDPQSRVEEIVWGGVRVDGIPALDNPKMVEPEEAGYLTPQERVFGVSLNGDTRAYPTRFLDWHEMFNDVVGGEPVSLAY